MMIKKSCHNETALLAFSGKLAHATEHGVIFLQGPLGAGKTTFVRGFLRVLGYQGIVKSPTYGLVEEYTNLNPPVYHFDLYRLNDPAELENMGFREYLQDKSICLIEWPERGGNLLPTPDVLIEIGMAEVGRDITLSAKTAQGTAILKKIEKDL